MQPTTEILVKISQNSTKNEEEIFTRLYRYLLRPDIYYVAYKNLYANSGAATKGVNDDTADGFSEEKINKIIKALADGSYAPKPVRRAYILKQNGKKRPLGIPTFTDKLVQEVLRMVLEAVYEPLFKNCSHGFRPSRSCHTALKDIKHQFPGTRWFIEGDIKGCFDNIDHTILTDIVNRKVKDARIIQLIYKFLKAGYMENWQYHKTYSGTPQGGIISPLLANIYLHELDKFVNKLKAEFDKSAIQNKTDKYRRIGQDMYNISRRINRIKDDSDGNRKKQLVTEFKTLRAELLKTPSKLQTDKKIKYIRYADDFLIGINGSREDCQAIKNKLSEFIGNTLKMEMSEEKTLITHSSEFARFLGYDIRVRRDNSIRRNKVDNYTTRTLSNKVEILIPFEDKINKFLFSKSIIIQKNGEMFPTKRPSLLGLTDLEIVMSYNAELRGICNYYGMASNFCGLNYFAYLMEYSCLKTLADKHRSTIGGVKRKYKDGKGKWSIPYETKVGKKRMYFADYAKCKNTVMQSDYKSNSAIQNSKRTTFEQRLNAKVCELCGTTESKHYEIHHVNKVKNLKGKEFWEQVMIAKRRKTMVLCRDCHKKIKK